MSQNLGNNKPALILSENYSILFSFNPEAVRHYKDFVRPLKNLHKPGILVEEFSSNKTVSNQSVFWKTADLGFKAKYFTLKQFKIILNISTL